MNFVILKLAYREFEPGALGLVRFLAMVPLMFLVAKVMGQQATIAPGDKGRLWLGGFLASGLYMVLFLEGTQRVTAAQGAIMLATAPLWISFFAILARQEQFRWSLVMGLVVAYAGVGMVILGGGRDLGGSPLGIALTLSSAMVWGLSVVFMNPLLQGAPAVGVFAKALPPAGWIMVPYGAYSVFHTDFGGISGTGWFALAYLVLVAGLASFVLYYVGVQAVGPAQAGMTQYIVPVVTAVGQFFVLGISMTPLQIMGIFVVLGGVALARHFAVKRLAGAQAQDDAGTG